MVNWTCYIALLLGFPILHDMLIVWEQSLTGSYSSWYGWKNRPGEMFLQQCYCWESMNISFFCFFNWKIFSYNIFSSHISPLQTLPRFFLLPQFPIYINYALSYSLFKEQTSKKEQKKEKNKIRNMHTKYTQQKYKNRNQNKPTKGQQSKNWPNKAK